MRMFKHPVGVGATLSTVVCLLLGVVAAASVHAQSGQLCFQETNQCIEGRFRQYWEQNGGLPVFGFPITSVRNEVNREDGQTYPTQWFQRTRFELHTDKARPYDVLLGRIGDDRLRQRGTAWDSLPRASGPQNGCLWFEQTRHNVCDQAAGLGFKTYWQTHGLLDPSLDARGRSLALFGLPLTEPTMEVNPANGQTYLTQWFERARFEWHPDETDQFKVLLGLLASEIQSQAPAAAPAPAAAGPTLTPTKGPTLTPTRTPTVTPTLTPTEQQNSESALKRHDAPPDGVASQLSYSVLNEGWVCMGPNGQPAVKLVESDSTLSHPAIVSIVNICATGFTAKASLQFELELPDGSVRQNEMNTSDQGTAVWQAPILASDPTGDYTITVTQDDRQATTTFTIDLPPESRMLIAPSSGPAGTVFQIAIAGYPPDQEVALDLYYYDKSLCSLQMCYAYLTTLPPVQTDSQGSAMYDLRTQPDDVPNKYVVKARPAPSTGFVSFYVQQP